MGSFWAKDSSVGFRDHKDLCCWERDSHGVLLEGSVGCMEGGQRWVEDVMRVWTAASRELTATFGPQGMAGLMMTVIEPDTGRIGC